MSTVITLNRIISALSLVALSAFHSYAAPSITVGGEGTSYFVTGSGMDGVSGIDLTLRYDSSLSSPSLSPGNLVSGAMMVPNTTVSGSIRFAIISTKPLSGSGQIVTINFASQKGGGGMTSCSGTLVDGTGKTVPVQCAVAGGSGSSNSPQQPGLPFSQPSTIAPAGPSTVDASSPAASSSTSIGSPASTTATSPVMLGPLSTPAETAPKAEAKPEDMAAPATPPAEAAVAPPAPEAADASHPAMIEAPAEETRVALVQKPGQSRMVTPRAILENFRTYQGEKSPAIFAALMSREVSPTIRQQPAIALSDGRSAVKITAKLAGFGEESPNFALDGARLVSLNREDAATWVIEALPQVGALQATLTILAGSEVIDFPLTLAPPVAGVSASEPDFAAFLTDSGAVPPKRDLNADGRHDYLDDYIYTANYLHLRGSAPKAP